MKYLNEDERTRLLHHYVQLEPKITVNCEPHTITYIPADDGITFYAISDFMQGQSAVAILPRSRWEQIHNGLTMGFFYGKILQTLEGRIRAGTSAHMAFARG